MQYLATIQAWDCLDTVFVSCQVRMYGGIDADASAITLHAEAQFRGEGQDDEREWLKDVLVALLEQV